MGQLKNPKRPLERNLGVTSSGCLAEHFADKFLCEAKIQWGTTVTM